MLGESIGALLRGVTVGTGRPSRDSQMEKRAT